MLAQIKNQPTQMKVRPLHIPSHNDVLFTISIEEACLYTSNSSIDWIVEYGSSHHVTPCKINFVSYETSGHYGRVQLGNNHLCNIDGVGDV